MVEYTIKKDGARFVTTRSDGYSDDSGSWSDSPEGIAFRESDRGRYATISRQLGDMKIVLNIIQESRATSIGIYEKGNRAVGQYFGNTKDGFGFNFDLPSASGTIRFTEKFGSDVWYYRDVEVHGRGHVTEDDRLIELEWKQG